MKLGVEMHVQCTVTRDCQRLLVELSLTSCIMSRQVSSCSRSMSCSQSGWTGAHSGSSASHSPSSASSSSSNAASPAAAASSPAATSPAASSPATSSSSSNKRRSIRFDLNMDLILLRQVLAQENPFVRGSPAMDVVAKELDSLKPDLFQGITKKTVRDRVLLLLEQHRKEEDFSENSKSIVCVSQ